MESEVTNKASSNTGLDEQEEIRHFLRVLGAFKFYKIHCYQRIDRAEKNYRDIPKHHQQLLPDFLENLSHLRTCISHNAEVIAAMVRDTATMFENLSYYENRENEKPEVVTSFDLEKVRTTLKQFVRDWSEDGKDERDACYIPIVQEIERLFPKDKHNPQEVNVLVPGAGLGRLAFEIAFKGYSCQGNEFSLFMLVASNFVLNKSGDTNCFMLYPWVYQFNNIKHCADQTKSILFPDINPGTLPPESAFSMVAGDFLEVYTVPDSWDCVATCYFIDTAHNILAYIETIYKILKPGGYWVNLGPLLYHFENMVDTASIELSYDVLKRVIKDMGFNFLKEETDMPSTYLQNISSMMKYTYECVFFVCQKTPRSPASAPIRSSSPPAASPPTASPSASTLSSSSSESSPKEDANS